MHWKNLDKMDFCWHKRKILVKIKVKFQGDWLIALSAETRLIQTIIIIQWSSYSDTHIHVYSSRCVFIKTRFRPSLLTGLLKTGLHHPTSRPAKKGRFRRPVKTGGMNWTELKANNLQSSRSTSDLYIQREPPLDTSTNLLVPPSTCNEFFSFFRLKAAAQH